MASRTSLKLPLEPQTGTFSLIGMFTAFLLISRKRRNLATANKNIASQGRSSNLAEMIRTLAIYFFGLVILFPAVNAEDAPLQIPVPVKPKVVAETTKQLSEVTVLGEVKILGTVQFDGSPDLLQILAEVNGLTMEGCPKNIEIWRGGENGGVFTADICSMSCYTQLFFVQSGDVITVKRRNPSK